MKKAYLIVNIITGISIFLTALSALTPMIIKRFILAHANVTLSKGEASSIGIIGGADGPTAIYVTSSPVYQYMPFLFGLAAAAGIILHFWIKRKTKED
ncbi:hypothetical protein SDC9_122845 [bioreactor metagenome]|uniref:Uncharacterized protein n=1 Tax=bioreactor metagenome TaxID=1076179 RepID=A0A645CG24_9ZZZZ